MNAEAVSLALGTVLAVGALAFVLYPLFFDVPRRRPTTRRAEPAVNDGAIRALREIEFDRATGKLSDADYAELKRDYGAQALRAMREAVPAAAAPQDAVEARLRAFRESHRECKTCGIRPETDAMYCSTCGSWLDGVCGSCGAEIVEPAAAHCSRCGVDLTTAV